MTSLYEFDKLPTTSGQALTEFSDRYLAAQLASIPDAWVDEYGDTAPMSTPKATMPLSAFSGKFQETTGDSRAETSHEDSIDFKVIEYDMGYEAKLIDLLNEVFAYRAWNQAAGYVKIAEQNHRATSVAALIEQGTAIDCWDGVKFFSETHPANKHKVSLGTWSNYEAAAKDCNSIANIIAQRTQMRLVKDVNGQKLGVNPDTIWVPTEKFELVDALTKQQNVSVDSGTGVPGKGTATMSNPIFGLKVREIKNLTNAANWFLVDSQLIKRMPAYGCLRYSPGLALELRQWGEESDFFKNTGKLKNSAHIWYGFGLVFPHAIRMVTGA